MTTAIYRTCASNEDMGREGALGYCFPITTKPVSHVPLESRAATQRANMDFYHFEYSMWGVGHMLYFFSLVESKIARAPGEPGDRKWGEM